MVRLRNRTNGVVVTVDDVTAAALAGYEPADKPAGSKADEKPKTARRAADRNKK